MGYSMLCFRRRLTARLAELNSEARRLLTAFSNAGNGGKLLAERPGGRDGPHPPRTGEGGSRGECGMCSFPPSAASSCDGRGGCIVTEIAVPFEPKIRSRARRLAEAPAAPLRRYPARIARQLALAHALQRQIDKGEFADYASMARALGFTGARVTQIMDLLLLAPTSRRRSCSRWPAAGRSQLSGPRSVAEM